LRSASQYFADVKTPRIEADQLSLAKELIQRKAGKFDPKRFTDNYETALRELVEAKLKNRPLPVEQKPAGRGKVINLMDALRRSVDTSDEKKPSAQGSHAKPKAGSGKHGLTVVPSRTKHADKRRKSA